MEAGVSGYTYNDHYLHNCLIVGNHGRRNGGGIYGYRMTIVNCTIVNNTVEYYGGGVYRGALVNSIVFGNTSENEGNNYLSASAKNCCCPDLTAGVDGNITNSPTFVSGYYPASDSPCIDAGGNTNVATAFDLDRNLRIQSGTVDMGAYEWQEAPRLACSLGGTIIKQVAGLQCAGSDRVGCVEFRRRQFDVYPFGKLRLDVVVANVRQQFGGAADSRPQF